MKPRIIHLLLAFAIVFALFPTPTASTAAPSAAPALQTAASEAVNYYLEFSIPDLPPGKGAEQVESWYTQRFAEALGQTQPQLQQYIDSGLLESFSPDSHQFRVLLVKPAVLVIDELGKSPDRMRVYPARTELGILSAAQPDSKTRQQVDTVVRQQESLLDQPDREAGAPAAPDAPQFTAGHFRAQLWDNDLQGLTSEPYSDYVAGVSRGDYLIAVVLGTSDEYGNFYVDFYDFSGNFVVLQPGDHITVSSSSDDGTELVLPEIVVQVNTAQETVKMTAPPEQPVSVRVNATSYVTIDGTTSSEGVFIADFNGLNDIQYNDYGYAYYYDTMDTGNEVYVYFETPYLYTRLSSYWLEGKTGQTGGGIHQILLSQYAADGSYLRSELATVDNEGWFEVYVDLPEVGERFEFTSPSGEVVALVIPLLTVTADVETNVVSGQAPPNAALSIDVWDLPADDWYYKDITADSEGAYSTNLDGLVDITPQDYIYVYYYLPDGNYVYRTYRVPYVTLDLVYSETYGYVEANSEVTVYLKDSMGVIKATKYDTSGSDGYFYAGFWDYSTDMPMDIQTGDSLQVVTAAKTITITLPVLTANVDQATNLVSGQAVPNASVRIRVCWPSAEWIVTYCDSIYTMAGADGAYTTDFTSDHDIRNGDRITAYYSTIDGHLITDAFYLPNLVYVNQWENFVYVYTSPYALVTATLRDNSGTVKASTSGYSQHSGYIYFGTLGDIIPGDSLEIYADGVSTEVEIVDLQITAFDRQNNLITGHGPAYKLVAYSVDDVNYDKYIDGSVHLDEDGNFLLDFSYTWDVRGGDIIYLRYMAANGTLQEAEVRVPGMRVYPAYRQVTGYGAPSSTVVVYLLDSSGNLKESTQTVVYDWGYWYAYFNENILPGDRLEMHNAGVVSTMTIQSLSVTADPLTDTVTGSGPASAWVTLEASGYLDSYDTDLLIGTDGTFSLDLSAGYDIQNGTYLYLEWFNDEGDGVRTTYIVPTVHAYESYNSGGGYSSTFESYVTLNLSSGPTLKASTVLTTSLNGYFWTDAFCNAGAPVDVAIGDTLSTLDASLTLASISATTNPDTDTISGMALPNAELIISVTSVKVGNYSFAVWVNADSSGAFSYDFSGTLDLVPGDYAQVIWQDADGDRGYYLAPSVANTGHTAITSYPEAARPNTSVSVGWEAGGGEVVSYSYLVYDTVSHACDHNYSHYAGGYYGGGVFSSLLMAPAAGTIYLASYSVIDGYHVWSPEVAIPISMMAPVITDPVNGTTNDSTPTLQGFGPAGEGIEFHGTGGVLLGSTTVGDDGTFSYTLPVALGETETTITAHVPAYDLDSNTVYLTVNSASQVDPNHIFFTDRGTRFRIHDEQGYANLGGKIWIRPNDTVEIELPVRTCPDMGDLTLTVGAVTYPMVYAGDEVWVGSFLLPSSDYAIVANITCGAVTTNVLLTYGLIDPDGYVYAAEGGWIITGATVTCYKYNEISKLYEEWDAATWDQVNPQVTDSDGYYSFIVPPGQYKVRATYPGYLIAESPVLTVVDAPIHYNIPLYMIANYTYLALVVK